MQQFETLLKRDNGDKITIIIHGSDNFSVGKYVFSVYDIRIIPHRKRKFISIKESIENTYVYRGLNFEEKKKVRLEEFLKYVTVLEINKALENAWLSIKPEPIVHLILD